MKKVFKFITVTAACAILLVSCSGNNDDLDTQQVQEPVREPAGLESTVPLVFPGPEEVAANQLDSSVGKKSLISYYDASDAVAYANHYWGKTRRASEDARYFPRHEQNCTNFVSQCLLAGLSGDKYMKDVYADRNSFKDASGSYHWYYYNSYPYGVPSWRGAHNLAVYASKQNDMSFVGLNFEFITKDSATEYLDVDKVKKGDIIFADWENDGRINHVMIITSVSPGGGAQYSRIRLASHTNHFYGRDLGEINRGHGYKAIFTVYRPIGFTH